MCKIYPKQSASAKKMFRPKPRIIVKVEKMMVALIHWRIKPDIRSRREFRKHWKKENTVGNRRGLIAEFLSSSFPLTDYPYTTWHLDGESLGDFKSYVTIGLWKSSDQFEAQVSRHFNDKKPMLRFEKYRRRRVVFGPIAWRIGNAELPTEDSDGVE